MRDSDKMLIIVSEFSLSFMPWKTNNARYYQKALKRKSKFRIVWPPTKKQWENLNKRTESCLKKIERNVIFHMPKMVHCVITCFTSVVHVKLFLFVKSFKEHKGLTLVHTISYHDFYVYFILFSKSTLFLYSLWWKCLPFFVLNTCMQILTRIYVMLP